MERKAKKQDLKADKPAFLVGLGYDVHNLVAGKAISLGGVRFASPFAVQAHSDGDVPLHALASAVLGALGLGDLGEHFSDRDPANKGLDSARMVRHALRKAAENGYELVNADITVVSQDVMIAPLRADIVASLRAVTGCARVNVKGTRWERRSKQIAAHCAALLRLAG